LGNYILAIPCARAYSLLMESIKTLQQAVIYFSDFDNCRKTMIELRWHGGKVKCPHCGSEKITYLAKNRIWKCYKGHSKPTFSLKTGMVFEDSPLGLDKWLAALWLVVNCKNGISSCEVSRDLGVTQKSAWFMMHRLRFALKQGGFGPLSGEVEANETFIGGKARNIHLSERQRRITVTSGKDKTAVMGILERGGKVRTTVLPNRRKKVIQTEVKKHFVAGSALYD
jgi:transposase-like protein